MIKKLFVKYKEIILYIIVGCLTTLVNWVAYSISTFIIPVSDETTLVFASNVIAWIIAVLFAYVTNKKWVFESKTDSAKELAKEFLSFIGARLFTGVLEIVAVPFLVMLGLNQTLFGVEGLVSKILVSVVVMVLNYVFSKLFIFKKKQD